MADEEYPKFMTMKEAVEKYVHDGDMVIQANFGGVLPIAQYHEIIRQKKRNITLAQASFTFGLDEMIHAGCVKRLITSFIPEMLPRALGDSPTQKAIKEGLEIEEYSNWIFGAMCVAGAMNLPFFPLSCPGVMQSDMFKKRSFLGEDKFKVIENPFHPEQKTVLVPPLKPDVAILHVGRADKEGNGQYLGPWSIIKYEALCAKKIIVSADEIVPKDVIYRSPNLTIVPSFRTTTISHEPWGAHPWYFPGYYDGDMPFIMLRLAGDMDSWMDEWIYGIKDRLEYVEHYIEKFGLETLLKLKAKEYPCATANLGSSFMTNRERLDVTEEQMLTSPDFFEVEV